MIWDLILMFGPGIAGLLLQVIFWRSLSHIRKGLVRADNGVVVQRNAQPGLFWTYVAIWVGGFLLSLALLFWSVAWAGYMIEYGK